MNHYVYRITNKNSINIIMGQEHQKKIPERLKKIGIGKVHKLALKIITQK